MLINLCEKGMTGGQSGPVGRTVRQYNSLLSREVAALFGLEGRIADGPPLGCGQSTGVLKKSSREVVSLAWAERLDCGRSDQGVRTERPSTFSLSRGAASLSVSECLNGGRSAHRARTVREGI